MLAQSIQLNDILSNISPLQPTGFTTFFYRYHTAAGQRRCGLVEGTLGQTLEVRGGRPLEVQ